MKTLFPAIAAALLSGAILAGCRTMESAGDVKPIEGVTNPALHVLFDTTRPLPVSGTFGWGISLLRVDASHKTTLSEAQERIHQSLLGAMAAEGFTYTNEAPDYLVGFAMLAGAALDEADLNRSYGDLLAFPARADAATPLHYETGALILDIVERKTSRLLWRGAITAGISLDLPDEKKQARCDGAVRELLRHYPRPPDGR